MKSTSRQLRIAGAIAAAWTVFAVLLAEQLDVLRVDNNQLTAWPHSLAYQLVYCYTWALMTPLVLKLGRTFILENGRWKRTAPLHLAAALLLAGIAQLTQILVFKTLHVSWYPAPPASRMMRSVISTLDYGSMLYAVVLLGGRLYEYIERHHRAQTRESELREQLATAQLDALKANLHPHFLFNALNSISELIYEDPRAADRVLGALSDLLRTFLKRTATSEVTLSTEADFIRQYLEIQKIRFEERLAFSIMLDPRTVNLKVPSLILQPLVENAIVHGISRSELGGRVEITADVARGGLRLIVTDECKGEPTAVVPSSNLGTGLRNIRSRLQQLYGASHTFQVRSSSGGMTTAEICIPIGQNSQELQHAKDQCTYS